MKDIATCIADKYRIHRDYKQFTEDCLKLAVIVKSDVEQPEDLYEFEDGSNILLTRV